MKKRILKKRTRQGMMAAGLVALIVAVVGLYWACTRPAEKEESYIAFPYTVDGLVDYRVHLKPNSLYDESSLGPGRAYLSDLTSHIDTEFSYRLRSQSEANFRGEYYAIASIRAVTGQENQLVWEKKFSLFPPQAIELSGTEVLIEEEISIPYSHYLALVEQIVEESGFSPSGLNLEVDYQVALAADTAAGIVTEKAGPKLIVPLTGKIFSVDGDLELQSEGGIEATRTIAAPYYKEAKIGFVVLAVAMGVFLLFLFRLTAGAEEESVAARKLSRILKQYQDRIVESAQIVPTPDHGNVLAVSSFDDLLRAADELEKPIIYQSQDYGPGFEHIFYVFADNCAYQFNFGRVPQPSSGAAVAKRVISRRYVREQG